MESEAPTIAEAEQPSSTRPLALIVGGLVLLAVVTVILLSVRSPAEFEPGSPEALVQDYLQAVLDGDMRSAAGYLAMGSNCSPEDLSRYRQDTSNVRVTLVDVSDFGDSASVDVRIRYDEMSLGAATSRDWNESFMLVPEAGEWRITGEPWPVFFCEPPPS